MYVIIGFFVTLIAFAVIDYIKLRNMRDDHMRLAELGAILIRDRDLTSKQEDFIHSCLNDMFQWWFMPFAVLMIPALAWKLLSNQKVTPPKEIRELYNYPEFREFKSIHINSMTSSNSLFAIIFAVLMLLVLIPVFLVGGLRNSVRIFEETMYKASNKFGANHKSY